MEEQLTEVSTIETVNYESYLVDINDNLVQINQKQEDIYFCLLFVILSIAIIGGILFGKVLLKR